MKKKRQMNTMDLILLVIGLTSAVFIVVMILLFYRFQSTPDTLIMSYFAAISVEGGAMSWIKNVKEKKKKAEYDIDRIIEKLASTPNENILNADELKAALIAAKDEVINSSDGSTEDTSTVVCEPSDIEQGDAENL